MQGEVLAVPVPAGTVARDALLAWTLTATTTSRTWSPHWWRSASPLSWTSTPATPSGSTSTCAARRGPVAPPPPGTLTLSRDDPMP
jgi:hypothetical protein